MDTDVAEVIAMAKEDLSQAWTAYSAALDLAEARRREATEAAQEARSTYEAAQEHPAWFHPEALAAQYASTLAANQQRDSDRTSAVAEHDRRNRATIQAARYLVGEAADVLCDHDPILRLDPMPAEAVGLFVRHGVDDGLTVTISDAAIAARVKRLIMGRLTDDGRDGFRQIGGCRWAAGIFDHVVLQDSKVRFGTSTGGSVCIVGHSPVVSVAIPGVDFDRITYRAQQAGTIPAVTA